LKLVLSVVQQGDLVPLFKPRLLLQVLSNDKIYTSSYFAAMSCMAVFFVTIVGNGKLSTVGDVAPDYLWLWLCEFLGTGWGGDLLHHLLPAS